MTSMKVYRQRLEAERTRLQADLAHLTREVAESTDELDPERGGWATIPPTSPTTWKKKKRRWECA